MKPIRKHLKLVALALAIIFLALGCSVYNYKPTTIDEAVKSGFARPIKVESFSSETYKFIKLEKANGKIYGLAKKQSKTAKKLKNQITEISQYNSVKILLEQEQFKKIFIIEKDKPLSILLSIGIPVVIVGGVFAHVAATYSPFGGN